MTYREDVGARMLAATEAMNQILAAAERVFTEMHLGVTAAVEMPNPHDDPAPNEVYMLRFGKKGREWRLTLSWYENGVQIESERNILECSKAQRQAALKAIQPLAAELIRVAEHQATAIFESVKSTHEFLETLKVPGHE